MSLLIRHYADLRASRLFKSYIGTHTQYTSLILTLICSCNKTFSSQIPVCEHRKGKVFIFQGIISRHGLGSPEVYFYL